MREGTKIWRSLPEKARWLAVFAGLAAVRQLSRRSGRMAAIFRYAPLALQVAGAVAAWPRNRIVRP